MGWPVAVLALALLAPQQQAARKQMQHSVTRLFRACMDRERITALGSVPIQPELRRLAAIATPRQLAIAIAGLHGYGIFAPFTYAPPPRPRPRPPAPALRLHMQRDFMLAGDSAAQAAHEARDALALTLALQSDPPNATGAPARSAYQPLRPRDLQRIAPAFDWRSYFSAMPRLPPSVHPGDGPQIATVNRLLQSVPLAAWRSYLRWEWIHATAAWLSPPFVTEEFLFNKLVNHAGGGQPGRGSLCDSIGSPYSSHDYRAAGIRDDDFFGDMLRLSSTQARHALW